MLKPRGKRATPGPAPAPTAFADVFADRRKCRDRRVRNDYASRPGQECRRQRWDRRRHRFDSSEWYLRASYVEHEEFW
jgi:hypothetical protein